ncbi:MAG: twin-arginine translocase TatA/TatE family subunit [Candidatus Heimdallarchaeota archaeon]|nr:twin-arginine translocase TatA/TatE family subunit [Candidatus Heimdallarchaeota archaeon]
MAGYQEVLLLIGLALLLFGPNKLPELARALGKATTEYKRGIKEAKKNIFEEGESNISTEDMQLISAAKEMGIPTEGRSMEEIASDIVNA